MGYSASCSGKIKFCRPLTSKEFELAREALSGEFEVYQYKAYTDFIGLWVDDKYHEDNVVDILKFVSRIAPISSGEIDYIGEDYYIWRFVFRNGIWVIEKGDIVYGLTKEKIEKAEQCLIDNGVCVDEAKTVLQALGYILMDEELYP